MSETSRITVKGTITVPDDILAEFVAYLNEHRDLTLAESGCVFFSVEQRPGQPNVFEVDECFENRQAFEFHRQRMSATNWSELTKNAVRNYQVKGFE